MAHDIAIVGGGILGLATAYRLLQANPKAKVILVEKENRLAAHQTGNNSGVLHSGLYYKPGSEKAQLSVVGIKEMVDFCRDYGIAHEICGKIVVATNENELPRLENLWERGIANGMEGLRKLNTTQIKEIEPHTNGIAAIHVPQEGIVDYPGVCEKLGELILEAGGEIKLNAKVRKISDNGSGWVVESTAGHFHARFVVTCGGLHADRLAQFSGQKPAAKIIPFRGEYFKLKKERQYLVRNLIYPVPDPQFPFLGVHFTRLVLGGVEAGPNAVLAFSREGYTWSSVNFRDLSESLLYPGIWKFLAKYPSMCGYEIHRSLSKAEFTRSLQKLVPEVRADDLEPGGSGVRAQALLPNGRLIDDFHFEEAQGILHVINAPSPAATASLAIGRKIAKKVLTQLRLNGNNYG